MAGDRPCIEMGSRRTQELAAVAAARAAYVAGFEATSNLEAGRRYGVPTRGTSAHSFTLLHADERQAALAGKPSRVRIKVNSMIDEEIIDALYAASRAGVVVEVFVRGICGLRPGVPHGVDPVR